MIRFLIDKFRKTPGPLQKTRLLVADLSEEVLDLAAFFLSANESRTDDVSPSPDIAAAPPSDPSSQTTTSDPDAPISSDVTAPAETNDPFVFAINDATNRNKQVFKILAILFHAKQKETGPLSAREISQYGAEVLNLHIKHENVRKIIRIKLDHHVNVHAQGNGRRTVYKYEISTEGYAYFNTTFLATKQN